MATPIQGHVITLWALGNQLGFTAVCKHPMVPWLQFETFSLVPLFTSGFQQKKHPLWKIDLLNNHCICLRTTAFAKRLSQKMSKKMSLVTWCFNLQPQQPCDLNFGFNYSFRLRTTFKGLFKFIYYFVQLWALGWWRQIFVLPGSCMLTAPLLYISWEESASFTSLHKRGGFSNHTAKKFLH